jgi:hypothetical protein
MDACCCLITAMVSFFGLGQICQNEISKLMLVEYNLKLVKMCVKTIAGTCGAMMIHDIPRVL